MSEEPHRMGVDPPILFLAVMLLILLVFFHLPFKWKRSLSASSGMDRPLIRPDYILKKVPLNFLLRAFRKFSVIFP